MSEKIKPHHIERKAILYVRQSSTFQVQNNLESQKLQYVMRDRLCSLGWCDIEVIDEDLGRSASGTVTRAGFERMVAEVCLGQVGAVAAREVSRFARNSREWQKLVEVCRVVDTLLIDQEMIYTPRQSNDRLLLGLKGSLNEYELDLLRQRSVEARREKAKRGELIVTSPAGISKVRIVWKRIRTSESRNGYCWYSASSSNLAQHGKRCCGFSNMDCRFRFLPRATRSSGDDHGTPPSIRC
jgi:DNA invertase Pin-like site-specific DNA recombinase